MPEKPVLYWHRQDLRLQDNPALRYAASLGKPVLPIFIWAPDEELEWTPGAASRWWLHHSLVSLESAYRQNNLKLTLRRGSSLACLHDFIRETGADTVVWSRRYEPHAIARDGLIRDTLKEAGVQVRSFNSALLFEPWEIMNKAGAPFKVFTAYWNCLQAKSIPEPGDEFEPIPAPKKWPSSLAISDLQLLPKLNWADGFSLNWTPGESGALKRLEMFLRKSIEFYPEGRDFPSSEQVSRLAAHLHFGELGPRMVWRKLARYAVSASVLHKKAIKVSVQSFYRQLVWREFSYYLLYHYPQTPAEPMRKEFLTMKWQENPKLLSAWQQGRTGYPLVDAGMRELWKTGSMHNRVRMIAASFLVKHLLIHWRRGAEWFWDTLVDADLANNTMGWQWVSGCGVDAAPYFRIFNPILQGERFDKEGVYVRKWLPELRGLPSKWIHAPWKAPKEILSSAGIQLGKHYPEPIVDHEFARRRALAAYDEI